MASSWGSTCSDFFPHREQQREITVCIMMQHNFRSAKLVDSPMHIAAAWLTTVLQTSADTIYRWDTDSLHDRDVIELESIHIAHAREMTHLGELQLSEREDLGNETNSISSWSTISYKSMNPQAGQSRLHISQGRTCR